MNYGTMRARIGCHLYTAIEESTYKFDLNYVADMSDESPYIVDEQIQFIYTDPELIFPQVHIAWLSTQAGFIFRILLNLHAEIHPLDETLELTRSAHRQFLDAKWLLQKNDLENPIIIRQEFLINDRSNYWIPVCKYNLSGTSVQALLSIVRIYSSEVCIDRDLFAVQVLFYDDLLRARLLRLVSEQRRLSGADEQHLPMSEYTNKLR